MIYSTTYLKILDMSCASCASAVEASLEDVGGVEDVIVDFDAKRATVRHDPDVSAEQFTSAVESVGYEAREEVIA